MLTPLLQTDSSAMNEEMAANDAAQQLLQFAQPNIPQRGQRAIRGDAERPRRINFAADRDLLAGERLIHDLHFVDPGFDPSVGDAEPDRVPATVIEVAILGRGVLRGIQTVDAGEAAHAAAPAADDQAARILFDRKRQSAEEVRAVDALRLERDFVIAVGHRPFVIDAGEVVADPQQDCAVFDLDVSLPAKLRRFPTLERLPVEERRPLALRPVLFARRLGRRSPYCWGRLFLRLRSGRWIPGAERSSRQADQQPQGENGRGTANSSRTRAQQWVHQANYPLSSDCSASAAEPECHGPPDRQPNSRSPAGNVDRSDPREWA